jgi:hypothetical protein
MENSFPGSALTDQAVTVEGEAEPQPKNHIEAVQIYTDFRDKAKQNKVNLDKNLDTLTDDIQHHKKQQIETYRVGTIIRRCETKKVVDGKLVSTYPQGSPHDLGLDMKVLHDYITTILAPTRGYKQIDEMLESIFVGRWSPNGSRVSVGISNHLIDELLEECSLVDRAITDQLQPLQAEQEKLTQQIEMVEKSLFEKKDSLTKQYGERFTHLLEAYDQIIENAPKRDKKTKDLTPPDSNRKIKLYRSTGFYPDRIQTCSSLRQYNLDLDELVFMQDSLIKKAHELDLVTMLHNHVNREGQDIPDIFVSTSPTMETPRFRGAKGIMVMLVPERYVVPWHTFAQEQQLMHQQRIAYLEDWNDGANGPQIAKHDAAINEVIKNRSDIESGVVGHIRPEWVVSYE